MYNQTTGDVGYMPGRPGINRIIISNINLMFGSTTKKLHKVEQWHWWDALYYRHTNKCVVVSLIRCDQQTNANMAVLRYIWYILFAATWTLETLLCTFSIDNVS